MVPGRRLACDVACGNGQVAVELSRSFERVLATDASAQQVAEATSRPNIDYQVGRAEKLEIGDGSADLVAVGQAIHWFDHPRFFEEMDRVLRPGGVLAAWGYNFLEIEDLSLSRILDRFRRTVEPYWPPERAILDGGYEDIEFPYPAADLPTLSMSATWGLAALLGYLSTWSAVKEYSARRGRDPLTAVARECAELANQGPREVKWPLTLYVGTKPAPGG